MTAEQHDGWGPHIPPGGFQRGPQVPHTCTWQVVGIQPSVPNPYASSTAVLMRCTGCSFVQTVELIGTWELEEVRGERVQQSEPAETAAV